jgi:hypothetical protein
LLCVQSRLCRIAEGAVSFMRCSIRTSDDSRWCIRNMTCGEPLSLFLSEDENSKFGPYNQGLVSTSLRCVLEGLGEAFNEIGLPPNQGKLGGSRRSNKSLGHFGYLAPCHPQTSFPRGPCKQEEQDDMYIL